MFMPKGKSNWNNMITAKTNKHVSKFHLGKLDALFASSACYFPIITHILSLIFFSSPICMVYFHDYSCKNTKARLLAKVHS